jgi:hypothetical protein
MNMNLLNEIVAAAVKGINIPFHLTHWEGSEDGHPGSLDVDAAQAALAGAVLNFAFSYRIADSFEDPGEHTLTGALVLPHGPSTLALDGAAVPDGRVVILPHVTGNAVRMEILCYCPEPDNPLHHLRFDADLMRV